MKLQTIRVKRLLKRISQYGGEGITLLSFLLLLLGLRALPKDLNIDLNPFSIIGIFVFFLLLARSLAGFIHDMRWKESKISSIVNIRDTQYDFVSMTSNARKEILFVGQNLYGLVTRPDFEVVIQKALDRDEPLAVSIILTTPQAMQSIAGIEAVRHLRLTSEKVRKFRDKLSTEKQKFFNVYYYEGASSISMTVIDPNSKSNGMMVFNAKWSVDKSPGSRLYCIVERWENKEIFDNLYGVVPVAISTNRLSIASAIKELESMCGEMNNS